MPRQFFGKNLRKTPEKQAVYLVSEIDRRSKKIEVKSSEDRWKKLEADVIKLQHIYLTQTEETRKKLNLVLEPVLTSVLERVQEIKGDATGHQSDSFYYSVLGKLKLLATLNPEASSEAGMHTNPLHQSAQQQGKQERGNPLYVSAGPATPPVASSEPFYAITDGGAEVSSASSATPDKAMTAPPAPTYVNVTLPIAQSAAVTPVYMVMTAPTYENARGSSDQASTYEDPLYASLSGHDDEGNPLYERLPGHDDAGNPLYEDPDALRLKDHRTGPIDQNLIEAKEQEGNYSRLGLVRTPKTEASSDYAKLSKPREEPNYDHLPEQTSESQPSGIYDKLTREADAAQAPFTVRQPNLGADQQKTKPTGPSTLAAKYASLLRSTLNQGNPENSEDTPESHA